MNTGHGLNAHTVNLTRGTIQLWLANIIAEHRNNMQLALKVHWPPS